MTDELMQHLFFYLHTGGVNIEGSLIYICIGAYIVQSRHCEYVLVRIHILQLVILSEGNRTRPTICESKRKIAIMEDLVYFQQCNFQRCGNIIKKSKKEKLETLGSSYQQSMTMIEGTVPYFISRFTFPPRHTFQLLSNVQVQWYSIFCWVNDLLCLNKIRSCRNAFPQKNAYL